MDFEDFPDISTEDEAKLRAYWTYLETYRVNVDNSLLTTNDIASVFTSPVDRD